MKRLVLGVLVSSMLLAACTAHEKSGDRAAAVGDWKSAYVSYRQALADEPEQAGLKEKYERARTQAMQASQARAQSCAQVADWGCALTEADFALGIEPGNAEIASFRANAATQSALARLETAEQASVRGQLPEAVAELQRAEQLSPAPEVKARAQAVRAGIVSRGREQAEGLRQQGNLQAASSLASVVAGLDATHAPWAQQLAYEYEQYTLAESERLTQQGDAARRHHDWVGARERYEAALALRQGGRAAPALEYVKRVEKAEGRLAARDWAGAAQAYEFALRTGQDDGYARSQLERVEPRPYRVALRSVLVSPTRPDGYPWVGSPSPEFSRLSKRIVQLAGNRNTSGLVKDLAMSIPAQNRPALRVEALLPEGLRLTTPARQGVYTAFDSELVAFANAYDERNITFRVLAAGPNGDQLVGSVDVPLKELAGHGSLKLESRGVLVFNLATSRGDGRKAGSYVDMSVVQPVQVGPGAPPHHAGPPGYATPSVP